MITLGIVLITALYTRHGKDKKEKDRLKVGSRMKHFSPFYFSMCVCIDVDGKRKKEKE